MSMPCIIAKNISFLFQLSENEKIISDFEGKLKDKNEQLEQAHEKLLQVEDGAKLKVFFS